MLKIYGSDLSGPANKVRFAANALGLPYEYIRVNMREGEHKKPEYIQLHPAGKVPVLDDDGFVLFESNAMMKYLAGKKKSDLYPQDLKERMVVDQWIDFASFHVGDAVSRVTYNRFFASLRNFPVDESSLKAGLEFLNRYLPIIDGQLGRHAYLAGDKLTLADINLLAILDPAEVANIDLSPYKNIVRWRKELKAKDFYTKCHREYAESLARPAEKK